MPGLAGIFSKTQGQDHSAQLRQMLEALSTESPVTYRTYENRALGIWLGWSCLESQDLDSLAVWTEERNALLVLLGEDVDCGIRVRRIHEGGSISAGYISDIARNLAEKGIGFLSNISGRFSGALWNERQRELTIFVDRAGFERLYLHEDTQTVYFSSESKSLLRVLPRTRQLNLTSLAEYFAIGFVGNNRSLFTEVDLLPPGSAWTYMSDSRSHKASYIEKSVSETIEALNEGDYETQLVLALTNVMERTADIRGKTAVMLNGGLEAIILMAWAPFPPLKVPCLIPILGGEDPDSIRSAQRVSEVCQQHSRILEINKSFISEFPALAKKAVVHTDGVVDVSGSVDLYFYRQAAEIADSCIRAEFGDPVNGYKAAGFPIASGGWGLHEEFSKVYETERNRHFEIYQDADPDCRFDEWLAQCYYPRIAIGHVYMGLRLPFLNEKLAKFWRHLPRGKGLDKKSILRLIARGDSRLAKINIDELIPSKRRTSESRITVYFKNIFRNSSRRRAGDSQDVTIFQEVKPEFRDAGIVSRRTTSSRFRVWYRTCFANYIRDILLDRKSRQRSYINGRHVEEMLDRHLTSQADHTLEIHRLLTVELAQRHLVDRS